MGSNGRGRKSPPVSLILTTWNGLDPHKRVVDLLQAAKDHGLATVVGIDRKTSDGTLDATRHLIDRLVTFDLEVGYIEERMNEIVGAARTPWNFWVCDDELPSEALWQFVQNIPAGDFIYRPQIISPTPGWEASYAPLHTAQPRIFPRDAIQWRSGGFDLLPLRAFPERDIPEILWHFNLWATRQSREQKTALHEAEWMKAWEHHPWPPQSKKAYLWEDYPTDIESIAPWIEHRA